MEQDTNETPVIFRANEYGVTAVFPSLPAGRGDMTCYAHIGQHSGCNVAWYSTTRAATPAEYASLKMELENIGYKLKVYKRIQPWMRKELQGL